tara:strand:- start:3327 stop:3638 length:312 start_codon:yes stop_codon:yes gene_type:complete
MEVYAEYGFGGVIVFAFLALIMNLIKSQKAQNEDLDAIRVELTKMEGTVENVEGIVLKFLDRWNTSDVVRDARHEKLVENINDLGDHIMEMKGAVSRINGHHK